MTKTESSEAVRKALLDGKRIEVGKNVTVYRLGGYSLMHVFAQLETNVGTEEKPDMRPTTGYIYRLCEGDGEEWAKLMEERVGAIQPSERQHVALSVAKTLEVAREPLPYDKFLERELVAA